MKITIPKVITAIPLSEYAPGTHELDGKFLHVWVNPPREKLQAYNALILELETKEVENARQALFPEEPAGQKETPSALQRAYDLIRRVLSQKKTQMAEGIEPQLLNWYIEIWSQGPEITHWTIEELRILEAQDPAFLTWMIARTWQARDEHIQSKKKA